MIEFKEAIIEKVKSKIKTLDVKNHEKSQRVSFKKEVFLNPDFQELWNTIRYKTT